MQFLLGFFFYNYLVEIKNMDAESNENYMANNKGFYLFIFVVWMRACRMSF
jgi:hypothetical protein